MGSLFGAAVLEYFTLQVPLENWAVFVTQRDKGKAMDFISMLKKVAPPMGIEVHMYSTYMYLSVKRLRPTIVGRLFNGVSIPAKQRSHTVSVFFCYSVLLT